MNKIMWTRIVATFTLAVSCIVSALTWAHSDDYFDSKPAPHGGQVRMSGPFHFELVLSDGHIAVYVSDHADQPVQTAGATAKIEIIAGEKTSKIDLVSEGENMLTADWNGATSRDLTARLSVKLPGQKAQSAKFAPFAKKQK